MFQATTVPAPNERLAQGAYVHWRRSSGAPTRRFALRERNRRRPACYDVRIDFRVQEGGYAMTHAKLLARITARPDVFGGKPIIRDMRISVELILSLLAQGVPQEELLQDYPRLEPEDIRACVAYAHAVVAGDSLAAVSVAGG